MKNSHILLLLPLSLVSAELETITVTSDTTEVEQNIKHSNKSDLSEILKSSATDIEIIRNSSIGSDVILRGLSKDNINITIDDTKVCGACPNRMDPPSMHVSMAQIKDIEITKGVFDVKNFGSMGGAINVVTKDPKSGFSGSLEQSVKSYSGYKTTLTAEGGGENLKALIGYSYDKSAQYKDGNGNTMSEQNALLANSNAQKYKTSHKNDDSYKRNSFWAKAIADISNNQRLTVGYFGDRARDILYPRFKMDALIDDTDSFNIKYELSNLANFSDKLSLKAYHSKVKHLMSTEFRNTAMIMDAPVTATIYGATLENSIKDLDIGIDFSHRNWDGTKGTRANPSANILIPDVNTKNIALYLKNSFDIDNLNIKSGLRLDHTTITPNRSLHDANTSNMTFLSQAKDKKYNDISANILATYNLDKQNSIYVGVGQATRVPDAKELYWMLSGNTNLKESKNRQIDIGYERNSDSYRFEVSGFYSDIKDFIYQYKNSATTTTWANIDAKIYGYTLGLDYYFSDNFHIENSISQQFGYKKDNLPNQHNKHLAQIPPLKAKLALVADINSHNFIAEIIAASKPKIDSDNGEKELGGYSVFNLKYGYEFKNNISLSAGVNNLFNKTYAVSNSYIGNELIAGSGEPIVLNEAGRNYYLNIGYKF